MKNLNQFKQSLTAARVLTNNTDLRLIKGGVEPTMTDAPIDCRTISVPVDIVIES